MKISKVVIKNYRCLPDCTVPLNEHLNILVGNNECGKSTFLEAINLALSGLLNGRPIQGELHPYIFNLDAINRFIKELNEGKGAKPPSALIELYMADEKALAGLKGTINSLKEDVPGVRMLIEFNEDYAKEYASYIADPKIIKTVPVEYYIARWRNFADNEIQARSIPIKPTFIDASTIRNNVAANRYVLDIIKDIGALIWPIANSMSARRRMPRSASVMSLRVRRSTVACSARTALPSRNDFTPEAPADISIATFPVAPPTPSSWRERPVIRSIMTVDTSSKLLPEMSPQSLRRISIAFSSLAWKASISASEPKPAADVLSTEVTREGSSGGASAWPAAEGARVDN